MKTHTTKPERSFQCHICQKYFTTHGNRHKHIKIFHNNISANLSCLFCEKAFNYKGNLNEHILRHIQEKWYSCEICSIEFCSINNKNTHMRTHTGEKTFICKDQCGQMFPSFTTMKRHRVNVHGYKAKDTCVFCSKVFSCKLRLWGHILSKINERPYTCKICDKMFTSSQTLKGHVFIHGERKYSCNSCGRKFVSPIYIRTHKKNSPCQ